MEGKDVMEAVDRMGGVEEITLFIAWPAWAHGGYVSLGLILYFKLDQCGPHGLREKCPPWTGMNQRDPAGNQREPCWIILDSACPAWFSVE